MAFDPKNNTISVGEGEDFFTDSGQFFLLTLKKISKDPSLAPDHSLKSDWRVIEEWLGCGDGNLSESDLDKVGTAWKAYIAIGLAPSEKLQDSFDHQSHLYKKQGYSFEKDKAPEAVMDVFDRLLATDEEIATKQKTTIEAETLNFKNLLGDIQPSPGARSGNAVPSYTGSDIGVKVDRQKLPIAIAAIWLLVSIPFSIPIHEELFRDNDFLSRIFSWLIVGSAAWVPFGWRWLTNKQTYPRAFALLVVLAGLALVLIFLNDRYLDEYFYVPLGATVTFAAIILSHDGWRVFRKNY